MLKSKNIVQIYLSPSPVIFCLFIRVYQCKYCLFLAKRLFSNWQWFPWHEMDLDWKPKRWEFGIYFFELLRFKYLYKVGFYSRSCCLHATKTLTVFPALNHSIALVDTMGWNYLWNYTFSNRVWNKSWNQKTRKLGSRSGQVH